MTTCSLCTASEPGAGARNLFDQDYQLVDGFPEEGRSFFVDLRMRL